MGTAKDKFFEIEVEATNLTPESSWDDVMKVVCKLENIRMGDYNFNVTIHRVHHRVALGPQTITERAWHLFSDEITLEEKKEEVINLLQQFVKWQKKNIDPIKAEQFM